MSELPDGLPSTCLDCDVETTTVSQFKDEQLLLTLELNGNKASMIVSYHQAAAPFFDQHLAPLGGAVNKMADFNPLPIAILEIILVSLIYYFTMTMSVVLVTDHCLVFESEGDVPTRTSRYQPSPLLSRPLESAHLSDPPCP